MIANKINISQTIGNRYDVSFYNERFDFVSNSYPSYELGQILFVNPAVSYKHIADDDLISFVPMEAIDEQNGIIAIRKTISYSNIKGYTKFQEGDLLWAKITPCMQNGKSAIARNLINGVGCGSTEFYVLRPKSDKVLIEYIHYILRDNRVLESARNSFGGSAGQQRVSSSYLKSIKIPLPPIEVQQQIVDIYSTAQKAKQAKEQQANTLLESIDDYLLSKLGINIPNIDDDRNTVVKISSLMGQRFDPDFNNMKYQAVYSAMRRSIYPVKTLSDICDTIFQGVGKNETYDNTYTLLKVKNIQRNNKIDFEDTEFIKSVPPSKLLQYNDIISPFIGEAIRQIKFSVFKEKTGNYTVDNNTGVIRVKQGIIADYIAEYLCSTLGAHQIKRLIGGGVPFLGAHGAGEILVNLPPLDLQEEIALTISKIRKHANMIKEDGYQLIDSAKKQIEKIVLE